MLTSSIKIGDRVEVYQLKERLSGKVYISQVEDIISDTALLVHVPISYGQTVKLPETEKYNMIFFTDKGMLSFETLISGFEREGKLHFMRVALTSTGERIQRREFFRFNCLLPLKFRNITGGEPADGAYADGIIKDIGGGGFKCVSNEEVGDNAKISSVIMLNDDMLSVKAKVLNKIYFPKSNFKYQYRAEFFDMSHDDQDKIIRYIFNEERKMMRRTRI